MISSLTSRFEFANRRALFLSAHKAAVYHWYKGAVGSSYLFDVNDEGREYFERYLRETANTPFYVLLDVFEEEFRRETIPHVFGQDRKALIKRKQGRLFRDTPYYNYEVQGREAEGRRDDRVLLTAMTNPNLLKPWLHLFDKYKIPLAGINSLPLFTKTLLKLIPQPSDHMLIVTLQSISGLRQTFFQKNEFRVSRLVQMPRYGTEPYAPYISGELDKIQKYLNSLRLVSPDEPLDIYFISAGELLDELRQEHSDSSNIKYHLLDFNTLVPGGTPLKKITTPFSDHFIIHQLLKNKPANYYASGTDTRYFTMRRLRFTMLAISLFLIVGGSIWSGFNFMSGLSLKQNSIAAEKKTQFYTTRYQIARERLPQTPVEPSDLKVAVDLSDILDQYKTSPLESIKTISRGLGKFPTIHLDNIEWAASIDPNLNIGGGQASTVNQGVVGYSNLAYSETGYRFYQISLVNGYIEHFDGNFRQAISMINQFVEELRNQDAVHDISIITLPLDVSSTTNLSGDVQTQEKLAKFSLRVVIGISNEA